VPELALLLFSQQFLPFPSFGFPFAAPCSSIPHFYDFCPSFPNVATKEQPF
jgi:hypothetical protein